MVAHSVHVLEIFEEMFLCLVFRAGIPKDTSSRQNDIYYRVL
jgi:hypothetical protein